VFLLILSLLTFAAYRLFLHPLAQVPGPRLAAITNIWQAHYVRNGRVRELGKGLPKKYGPVVRVGPNEVWFNTADAFKQIYRMSNSRTMTGHFLPLLTDSRRRKRLREVRLLL
jgi:hypothetical protein